MNDNSGLIIALLAFLGLGAIAIMATTRQREETISPDSGYLSQPVEAVATAIPVLAYENEERTKIIRGPDRLIEEIIIHRKVTQNA